MVDVVGIPVLQGREDVKQYVAKLVHDERWNSQLPHLCKALEIIAAYRGRGAELIEEMSTELDLG